MPRPIALSDAQLTAIMHAAGPLPPADRGAFLESVAAALQPTIGDGNLHRIVRELQRKHFDPPVATAERTRKL